MSSNRPVLYVLMYEKDGEWRPAFRTKKYHSIYSSPETNRILGAVTQRRAELALKRGRLPEGTVIVKLEGEPV